jgi:hypothetical protein
MALGDTSEDAKPTAVPGHFVVIAMLAVALAAAAFAWWWNFQRGRKALEFYGPEAATLVRTAPKVELLRGDEPVRDISQAKGLLNARTSLLGDASYLWASEGRFIKSDATLRFSEGERSIPVSFDFENRMISVNGKMAVLNQKTADGWRSYLARQTGDAQLTPPGPTHTAPSE